MIGVLIIPTGIGCTIGGHAGDASPVAKLIATICDTLLLHPNVVNASDINEMPANSLYIEGSMLDMFLEGSITLRPVSRYNKILLVVNKPLQNNTVHSVAAAKATIGSDVEVIELDVPLQLIANYNNLGCAQGNVLGWKELIKQVSQYEFDALAIQTPIEVSKEIATSYLENGGVNPWGGVEAVCSRLISQELGLPVAHSPFEAGTLNDFKGIVDQRVSAEMVSVSYLHCILKGLHRAPQIGDGLTTNEIRLTDINFLITPWGCIGRPHLACIEADIPIIAVKENRTVLHDKIPDNFISVNNYLEAAGVVASMRAGITINSVRA